MEENKKKKKVEEKEAPKKKRSPKKKTNAPKEKKVIEKQEEKEETLPIEESSNKFKEFISSYRFLYTTFGILFALVILLAIMVYTHERDYNGNSSNIVFSIMEENTHNSINIDLESLVGNVYALKVTNHRSGKISEKSIDYTITVVNDSAVELEVLADNQGDNLITDQKQTIIQGDGFGTAMEEEVIYYFRVVNSDMIKDGDSIQIIVAS